MEFITLQIFLLHKISFYLKLKAQDKLNAFIKKDSLYNLYIYLTVNKIEKASL